MSLQIMKDEAATAPGALCWIWPFHHRVRTGNQIWHLAGSTAGWSERSRWACAVAGAGVLPLLLCYVLGVTGHQWLTAFILFPLFISLVRDDRQIAAMLLVGTVFGVHSILAIALAAVDPVGTSTIMPGAAAYWHHQISWIRSGYDPEYQFENWLPAHFHLLGGILGLSFTSLGLLPFVEGIQEVDLMNYYVANLCASSESHVTAVMVGWHTWSILRGVAFTLLVYEVASWSLAQLCGRALSTLRRRRARWIIGLTFFGMDCFVKAATLPMVREVLWSNLHV